VTVKNGDHLFIPKWMASGTENNDDGDGNDDGNGNDNRDDETETVTMAAR